jgi:hypothetical protein
MKSGFVILMITLGGLAVIIRISIVQNPPPPDWTLIVNGANVKLGGPGIHFNIIGPSGYKQNDTIPNSQNPTDKFIMPASQFPPNHLYEVCISSVVGGFSPHCEFFTHTNGYETQIIK